MVLADASVWQKGSAPSCGLRTTRKMLDLVSPRHCLGPCCASYGMSTGLADKLYLCLRNSLLMLRVVRSEGLTVLTVVLLKMLGKWFMTCGGTAVPSLSGSYSAACVFCGYCGGWQACSRR
jgi:hypothetical protein